MTNKIIIDGIDVSECIHIQNFENVLFVCEETGRKCEVSKNCYYKQLKRKEQENEELKKQLEEYQDQEPTIVNTIGNLQLQVKAWIEQSAKYKQALDEIKNYQQRNCETCVFANTQKCNINCQVFVILDIINKAKDGE